MGLTTGGLLDCLQLRQVGTDRYRADNVDTGHFVVFGGQLLAQSIVAALVGHEAKTVKTLHTVFVRAGSLDAPLDIDVDRLHNGRAVASSTVTIRQGDRLCAHSMVLLTADEPDLVRHADRLAAPPPVPEDSGRGPDDTGGWEVCIVDDVDIYDPDAVGPARLDVWTRFLDGPSDLATSQALLAYATDGFLIGTAMRPHPGIGQSQAHKTLSTGVLSHTITFHEPFSASEWLLLSHTSPYAGRGRSYGRADVFCEDGQLVASFNQDNMIRPMTKSSSAL